MMRLILSSVVSPSSLAPASESAVLTAAEVLPPWLECASSMMMAKRRPRCSSPIASRMNGNFCTVEMMIFLPLSINLRRSPERSAWPTVAPTWANCLIVSRICLSRMRRSVTTMMESNTPASSFLSPINWWASQAMELDFPLPAECWMRYRFPAPCRCVSAKSRRTTSSWW